MYLQKGKGHIGPWLIHPLPQNIDVVEHYFGTFIIDKGVVTLALARRTPPHRDGGLKWTATDPIPRDHQKRITFMRLNIGVIQGQLWLSGWGNREHIKPQTIQVTNNNYWGLQVNIDMEARSQKHGTDNQGPSQRNHRGSSVCECGREKTWQVHPWCLFLENMYASTKPSSDINVKICGIMHQYSHIISKRAWQR